MSEKTETNNTETPEQEAEVVETPSVTAKVTTFVMPAPDSRIRLVANKIKNSKITLVAAGAVGTLVALVAIAAVKGGDSPAETPSFEEPKALEETFDFDTSVFEMETN